MNKNWNICYTTWLLTWWEIPPVWTYLLIAFSFSTQMYRWQEFSFLKSKIWMWRYWESSDFFFLSMFYSETSAKTLCFSLYHSVLFTKELPFGEINTTLEDIAFHLEIASEIWNLALWTVVYEGLISILKYVNDFWSVPRTTKCFWQYLVVYGSYMHLCSGKNCLPSIHPGPKKLLKVAKSFKQVAEGRPTFFKLWPKRQRRKC